MMDTNLVYIEGKILRLVPLPPTKRSSCRDCYFHHSACTVERLEQCEFQKGGIKYIFISPIQEMLKEILK